MRRHSLGRAAVFALALAFVPLLHAQQESSDARVVIHVDSLDRAAFSNIAELLQARVPGLTITRDGDGGLHWYMRGQGSYSESAPLVLVDGIRINVARITATELALRPSPLDEIDVENVERIEVLTGPAVTAAYGTGAGHGVIRITTFTPRAQATSWRLFTSAGVIEDDVTYPSSYGRPGALSGGGTTSRCRLVDEARATCTPTGAVTVFNPLESEAPFERALAARVGGAVASMTGPVAWRGGATFDREGSTSGRLASQRLHMHGAASLSPTSSTAATVRAFWTLGDADLPSALNRSLLSQGLVPGDPAMWSGFTIPPSSAYSSGREGFAASGRWRLASWLESNIAVGTNRLRDEDDVNFVEEIAPGISRTIERRGGRRRRDFTARVELTASYAASWITGSTMLTIERDESREEQNFRQDVRNNGTVAFFSYDSNYETEITGVDVTQRARLWERASVGGGVRIDEVGPGRLRVPLYPHVSLSWDARRPVRHAIGGIRLRAALGDAGNVPRSLQAVFPPVDGVPEDLGVELTREREVGIDVAAAYDRVALSLTWYTKRTSDVAAISFFQAPRYVPLEVLNRGIEATVRADVMATRRLSWDVRASYAYNHNELRRMAGPPFAIAFDGFTRQWLLPSTPLGAHSHADVVAAHDLDGDGLFDGACRAPTECEVQVGPADFRPAFPPTTASLETTMRLGPVTLGALFDHRSGHYRADMTASVRCVTVCRAAYDASTSEQEQARATAVQGGFSDTFTEDATFTRLREISLRVTAPTRWAEGFGASRLEISLAARNVAVWTDYSGLDPEATSTSWIPLLSRDLAATPIPRRISLRVTAARD